MKTIKEALNSSKQTLWCESFLGFKNIANEMGWNQEVPNNIAIISINNSNNDDVIDEYHICKDAPNVLNLDFDDIDPIAQGLPENSISYTYENLHQLGTYTTVEFFTREMAVKCVKFIEDNKDKHFFIHLYRSNVKNEPLHRHTHPPPYPSAHRACGRGNTPLGSGKRGIQQRYVR